MSYKIYEAALKAEINESQCKIQNKPAFTGVSRNFVNNHNKMKKSITLIATLLLISLTVFGQTSWIELKYPQSGILGRLVTSINNGDLQYEPISSNKGLITESYESAESIEDYRERMGTFFSKLFETKNLKIKNVSIKRMVIKSLSMAAVQTLTPGSKYVYEAISADTIVVTITKSRSVEVQIDEIAKMVGNNLASGSAEVLSKLLPIFEDMSYAHKDSVQYKMTIANPNVYYKVRVIEYQNIVNINWNKYWLYFLDFNKGKEVKNQATTKLVVDATGIQSQTAPFYPEFWGADNTDVQFKIELKKENGKLKLYILAKGIDFSGNWKIVKEIPNVDDNVWRLDRELVYSFAYKGVTKKVYVQCIAKKVDDNSIEIINWVGNRKQLNSAKTFMQYPEIKFEYKTRD